MSDLKRLKEMGQKMVNQEAKVKELEDELKAAKLKLNDMQLVDLPEMFAEYGLSEIKLEDGTVISVKEEVSCAITAKNKPMALKWLLDNNYGGLIKTEVAIAFERGDYEAAQQAMNELAERYGDVQGKQVVHPATLKSFVKERMEAGDNIPMELFSVHPYSKATMKKGKK